jgi:hypothetical protein
MTNTERVREFDQFAIRYKLWARALSLIGGVPKLVMFIMKNAVAGHSPRSAADQRLGCCDRRDSNKGKNTRVLFGGQEQCIKNSTA